MNTIIRAIDAENSEIISDATVQNNTKIQDVDTLSSDLNYDCDSDIDFDWDVLDNLDKRVNELPNMDGTTWFKSIGLYPQNLAEMEYFIEQLDILNLFKEMCIDDIPKLTSAQLDILYVLLRINNMEGVFFCEKIIRDFFINTFDELFYSHFAQKITDSNKKSIEAFLDEFYVDISTFILRLLTVYYNDLFDLTKTPEDQISYITYRMTRFCKNLLNSQYYGEILQKFEIVMDNDFFFQKNMFFHEIVLNIVEYIYQTVNPDISKLRSYINKFTSNRLPTIILLNEILTEYNINNIIEQPSDALEHFTTLMTWNLSKEEVSQEKIVKVWQYDNFLFPYEHKRLSKRYAFWQNESISSCSTNTNCSKISIQKKLAVEKAKQVGMKLYPDNSMTDILYPFVLHKLVDCSKTLVNLLVEIMEMCRNDPGILSKYDETDLETSYMIFAISNDINIPYDAFLETLKTKNTLIGEYPIEFILRLISRILNVEIIFYEKSMNHIEIDNCLDRIYETPVRIYQLNDISYYLLHDNQTEFEPIGNALTGVNIEHKYDYNVFAINKTTEGISIYEI